MIVENAGLVTSEVDSQAGFEENLMWLLAQRDRKDGNGRRQNLGMDDLTSIYRIPDLDPARQDFWQV